jgi:hypothetical protein
MQGELFLRLKRVNIHIDYARSGSRWIARNANPGVIK